MYGKTLGLVLGATLLAAPAFAQSRTGRVAEEVARTIEDTANAVGRVRDSLDRGINDVRWRGPERFAVDACRPYVERHGQMRVDHVRPYNAPRSFTCTVQDDGRVKLKTKRLRRY
jgi:hypothetical protein